VLPTAPTIHVPIDAGKKSTLLARVKNLAAQLNDPASKLTPEAAEEAFTKP
jgi:hypothetical protein